MLLETHNFEFGEFVLDPREKVLFRNGTPVPVAPKVLQLLFVLIENHDHIVEKEKLMEEVWADSFVEESNLTYSVRQLRKVLRDDIHKPQFIETVPRRGYRFIGEIYIVGESNGLRYVPFDRVSTLAEARISNDWRDHPVMYSVTAILLIVLLLAASLYIFRGGSRDERSSADSETSGLKFETVASSDGPLAATISPDGKYIAYANTASDRQSLWLRQLSSGINTQIVAPEDGVIYLHLEFSSSVEYVYVSRRYKDQPAHIDRVSILGGAVKTNILNNVNGAFTISPDDRRISFRRYEERKRSLLVANIDGSDAQQVFETTKTFTGNAFSPDGKTIAFASGQSDTGERDFGVYLIDAEGNSVKPATDFKWYHVRSVVWFPNQNGLLVTARTKLDEPQQLWEIYLPSGEVKKITDTQNDFSSLSATADLSNILLVQVSLTSNLYLAPSEDRDNVQSITQALQDISWTPEDGLVYCSLSGGNPDIWLMSSDKMNQKQLTTGNSTDRSPVVSPDGSSIVFLSDRSGKFNLWRIGADGSNPVQLTDGEGEQNPVFTPDGQFVVFNSAKDAHLWQVSIEGGEPTLVSGKRSNNISISPDQTKLALFIRTGDRTKIVTKSFPNDDLLQEFAIPPDHFAGRDIVWTEDGTALIYSVEDGSNVGNLWRQPLSGGEPEKLTNYNSKEIFGFSFSHDNSRLALVRGSWNYNAVLIKGFR